MEKAFGTLVRQLRLQKGYSLRELAWRVEVSLNVLSKMELGHFPPPSEQKIVLMAAILEQNIDELLALVGKVSSDLIEIILQRPKEAAALLRRLHHTPARKIAAATDRLAAADPLEFYPLENVSRENHTAVVGESGSGKALLTKYLITSYFQDAHVRLYDSDSAPREWGSSACWDAPAIMRRSPRAWPRSRGAAAPHSLAWGRRSLGGEGRLRRAFTVLYLGASAYQALPNIKDKVRRECPDFGRDFLAPESSIVVAADTGRVSAVAGMGGHVYGRSERRGKNGIELRGRFM